MGNGAGTGLVICTIADLITEETTSASGPGEAVAAVALLARGLHMDGVITGPELGAIVSAAARAD